MFIRNHLGPLSLWVVAILLVALEALLRSGLCPFPWIRILASGFEAGTVGGLADWFAVTALFREVPIPILRRHTNILLRKRELLTDHIVDVVQNQWLTPKAIGEYLAQRSPSSAILAYLSEPRHEHQLLEAFREMVASLVERLDNPQMTTFLAGLLKHQIDRSDLERWIGERLEEAIQRRDHEPVLDALLGILENSIQEGTLRGLIRGWIADAARSYGSRGTMKAATTWVLERSGGLDYDRAAEDVVSAVAHSIRGVRGTADHPLRRRLDGAASGFARGLARGSVRERALLERLRNGLAEGLESGSGLHEILKRTKDSFQLQLGHPESAVMQSLASFLKARIAELRTDRPLCDRLDGWVLQTAKAVAQRNPGMIGEMIRASLMKLEGPELVAQIESKVGPELQYIRLNGAVIGTLVGLGLGTLRWMLASA